MLRKKSVVIFFILYAYATALRAQEYSMLIKGGHVIDLRNNIDTVMDIAIRKNKIVAVANCLDTGKGIRVIDATGYYITPGLIDIHTHNFYGTQPHQYSNGYEAVAPDGFTFRNGVTTVVDAGSAGWKNFKVFKDQTIRHSKTRVLCFINIVGEGMRGGAYEQNLNDMDPMMTARVASENKEIVGIKVAHYSGGEWIPVDRAVAAGNLAQVPVMIDFGSHNPPLSLEELLLDHLRPGDIFTHTFAKIKNRTSIIDEKGNVYPFIWEAQKKGIVFDVGHGGLSFSFSQAVPALRSGLYPATISTDMHSTSINSGMKDLLNLMSRFLNIGMTLQQVIAATTCNPARTIQREELGNLSPDGIADIAIFSLRRGQFGFVDSDGFKINGDQKLECELTVKDGEIVYDLNGISSPLWTQDVD